MLCAQGVVLPRPDDSETIAVRAWMLESESNLSKGVIPLDTVDYISFFTQVDSTKTYNQTKLEVQKIIAALRDKRGLDVIDQDSLSRLFTDLLVRKIIPYWYGTTWDFNGYTAVPNQGVIACGYFVSTTLLHMGLSVNRYKMAQQLPIHEAMTLSLGAPVMEIHNSTVEENIEQLRDTLSEGIYFLGLDGSHVGYILKHNNNLFVIHANYVGDGGVAIEKIEESQAFAGFRRFYVAEISTNEKLIKKWVLGETITVVEGD